jgi:hypothetical protein
MGKNSMIASNATPGREVLRRFRRDGINRRGISITCLQIPVRPALFKEQHMVSLKR